MGHTFDLFNHNGAIRVDSTFISNLRANGVNTFSIKINAISNNLEGDKVGIQADFIINGHTTITNTYFAVHKISR